MLSCNKKYDHIDCLKKERKLVKIGRSAYNIPIECKKLLLFRIIIVFQYHATKQFHYFNSHYFPQFLYFCCSEARNRITRMTSENATWLHQPPLRVVFQEVEIISFVIKSKCLNQGNVYEKNNYFHITLFLQLTYYFIQFSII